jgi:spore coat protein H
MFTRFFVLILISNLIASCYKELPVPGTELIDTPDWTEETHGIREEPDYLRVFPQDYVKRLDIRIDPSDWVLLWQDMTTNFGPFGAGQQIPDNLDDPSSRFIPCDIFFEGKQWYKVGIRTKGNVPLGIVWSQGCRKFPFKLDFDEFEDRYPDIKNQRFYGFKQLSLKNGFRDASLVREKVVNELFRLAGLPVARSAYYELYLDYGEGQFYCGLYTMIEDVDDTVLHNYFTDITGILYKPEGPGARFAKIGFSFEDFIVHSDPNPEDFKDIERLFSILHDPSRIYNPIVWHEELNHVFDTHIFLKWLACNTVVQNWDSYGLMDHNYYLYHDPVSDLLVWIPWDHDNALKAILPEMPGFDFDFKDVNEDWPLIRFLFDNKSYYEEFRNEVSKFIERPFQVDHFIPILLQNLEIVTPFVLREQFPFTCLNNPEEFLKEREAILNHSMERYQDAIDFLNK